MHVNEMAKSVYNPSVNFVDFKYLERPKKDGKYIFLIRPYLRPVIKRQKCQYGHALSNWPCTKETVKTGTNVMMT